MDIKPYIALDIETTGLMEYDQVLQVAMIYDDGVTPIDGLERISFLVDNSNEVYHGQLDPVAISMNAWIFKEIAYAAKAKSNHLILATEQARNVFHEFLRSHYDPSGKSITFAGKNVKDFDIASLRRNGFITSANDGWISHRVIDIGSLYLQDFGYVPTQSEINRLTGRQPVSHDALDDATDVVCAIRSKLKVPV
jgi:hypothetical protein